MQSMSYPGYMHWPDRPMDSIIVPEETLVDRVCCFACDTTAGIVRMFFQLMEVLLALVTLYIFTRTSKWLAGWLWGVPTEEDFGLPAWNETWAYFNPAETLASLNSIAPIISCWHHMYSALCTCLYYTMYVIACACFIGMLAFLWSKRNSLASMTVKKVAASGCALACLAGLYCLWENILTCLYYAIYCAFMLVWAGGAGWFGYNARKSLRNTVLTMVCLVLLMAQCVYCVDIGKMQAKLVSVLTITTENIAKGVADNVVPGHVREYRNYTESRAQATKLNTANVNVDELGQIFSNAAFNLQGNLPPIPIVNKLEKALGKKLTQQHAIGGQPAIGGQVQDRSNIAGQLAIGGQVEVFDSEGRSVLDARPKTAQQKLATNEFLLNLEPLYEKIWKLIHVFNDTAVKSKLCNGLSKDNLVDLLVEEFIARHGWSERAERDEAYIPNVKAVMRQTNAAITVLAIVQWFDPKSNRVLCCWAALPEVWNMTETQKAAVALHGANIPDDRIEYLLYHLGEFDQLDRLYDRWPFILATGTTVAGVVSTFALPGAPVLVVTGCTVGSFVVTTAWDAVGMRLYEADILRVFDAVTYPFRADLHEKAELRMWQQAFDRVNHDSEVATTGE